MFNRCRRDCPSPSRGTKITGAQGRIRTFVPRKEEQIYSLLALTTHPPVQKRRAVGSLGLPPASRGTCGCGNRTAGLGPEYEEHHARKNPTAPNTSLGKIPYGVPLKK